MYESARWTRWTDKKPIYFLSNGATPETTEPVYAVRVPNTGEKVQIKLVLIKTTDKILFIFIIYCYIIVLNNNYSWFAQLIHLL